MIGLKRHTVKLMPHQAVWEAFFLATKKELTPLIGTYVLDIQHIGSTAIKHIVAKPIIDIGIAVADLKLINNIIPILEIKQYKYKGDSGADGGHLLVKDAAPEIRTHHIHVIDIKDEQWHNYLFFRDTLNANPKLALAYEQVKKQLAQQYPNNRLAYTNGKHDFIRSVLSSKK